MGRVPKGEIEIEEKKVCQKLFEQPDENDSVQDIYPNLKAAVPVSQVKGVVLLTAAKKKIPV